MKVGRRTLVSGIAATRSACAMKCAVLMVQFPVVLRLLAALVGRREGPARCPHKSSVTIEPAVSAVVISGS